MFKRILFGMLIVSLLGIFNPAGSAAVQAQSVPIGYVNTALLNVRAGPGANHAIATQVDSGQDLVLLGRNFDTTWLQVSVPGAGVGWVSARYIQTGVGLAGLPVADGSVGQPKAYSITGVNLRAGPGYAFAVLSTTPRNSDLVVLAQNLNGRWAQVRRPDGNEGWVDARYLKLSAALTGLPVSDRQYPAPGGSPTPPTTFAYWRGEYFNNRHLSGQPVVVRDDPAIDFTWWGNSALPGLPADDFSARWTRQLPFDAGTYRFRVTADDGVRLWVGDRLLLDDWREGQSTRTAEVNLAAGPQVVRLEYFERGGEALARLTWERVDAYPDWRGEYWNNTTLSGAPTVVRNDAALDFIWGQAAPDPRLPADYFSVRWTRTQTFEAGTYRFYAESDDGVRVYVNGRRVIDEWHDSAGGLYVADIALPAGAHTLMVEYYDNRYQALLKFWWSRL